MASQVVWSAFIGATWMGAPDCLLHHAAHGREEGVTLVRGVTVNLDIVVAVLILLGLLGVTLHLPDGAVLSGSLHGWLKT